MNPITFTAKYGSGTPVTFKRFTGITAYYGWAAWWAAIAIRRMSQ